MTRPAHVQMRDGESTSLRSEIAYTNQVNTLRHAEVEGPSHAPPIQGHCLQSFQLGTRMSKLWRALEDSEKTIDIQHA
jgi:hypothetical protein